MGLQNGVWYRFLQAFWLAEEGKMRVFFHFAALDARSGSDVGTADWGGGMVWWRGGLQNAYACVNILHRHDMLGCKCANASRMSDDILGGGGLTERKLGTLSTLGWTLIPLSSNGSERSLTTPAAPTPNKTHTHTHARVRAHTHCHTLRLEVWVCSCRCVGQLFLIKTFALKVNVPPSASSESYQQRLSRLEGDKESLILQVRTPLPNPHLITPQVCLRVLLWRFTV